MEHLLGAVVFSTWQGIFLILLCFGSLGIAIYCLLFMVPVKSFMQRINSLGGGMEGIRSHVDGVRMEVEERIEEVERALGEQLEEVSRRSREDTAQLRKKLRSASQTLRKLDSGVRELREELSRAQTHREDLQRSAKSLGAGVRDLRHDFKALEEELDAQVRQTVAGSYQQIEGTVLSALKAVQKDMLRVSRGLRKGGPGSTVPRKGRGKGGKKGAQKGKSKSDRQQEPGKIISAEPLFGESHYEKPEGGGEAEAESPSPEEQGAPTN